MPESHGLKIIQNIAIFNFGIFNQFLTCLVALLVASIFQNNYFWNSYELLSTYNVDVTRFARNMNETFLGDFQTPCTVGEKLIFAFARLCLILIFLVHCVMP